MALTPLHITNYCDSSSQWSGSFGCKYFEYEVIDGNYRGMCFKKAIEQLKKKHNDSLPKDFDKRPDNCPGYLYLKYADQGFDIK